MRQGQVTLPSSVILLCTLVMILVASPATASASPYFSGELSTSSQTDSGQNIDKLRANTPGTIKARIKNDGDEAGDASFILSIPPEFTIDGSPSNSHGAPCDVNYNSDTGNNEVSCTVSGVQPESASEGDDSAAIDIAISNVTAEEGDHWVGASASSPTDANFTWFEGYLTVIPQNHIDIYTYRSSPQGDVFSMGDQPITFRFEFANSGAANAYNANASIQLPEGFNYVSDAPDTGVSCGHDASSNILFCTISDLMSDPQYTEPDRWVDVQMSASAPGNDFYLGWGVSADESSYSGNTWYSDGFYFSVVDANSTDLSTSISANDYYVVPGTSTSLTASVINNGPLSAPDPSIDIQLPDGSTFESAYESATENSSPCAATENPLIMRCALGAMDPQAERSLTVSFLAPPSNGEHYVQGTVSETSLSDYDPDNNYSYASLYVDDGSMVDFATWNDLYGQESVGWERRTGEPLDLWFGAYPFGNVASGTQFTASLELPSELTLDPATAFVVTSNGACEVTGPNSAKCTWSWTPWEGDLATCDCGYAMVRTMADRPGDFLVRSKVETTSQQKPGSEYDNVADNLFGVSQGANGVDVCTNVPGFQGSVPAGWGQEAGGECSETSEDDVDECDNIDGVQTEVPVGLAQTEDDNCTAPSASSDNLNLGDGDDDVDAGAGNDTVYGGDGDDDLDGGNGNDDLDGQAGNDKVNGGKGKDRVRGGAGRDRVRGGGGRDRVTGGTGADVLDGGEGDDVIDAREGGTAGLIHNKAMRSLLAKAGFNVERAKQQARASRDKIKCGKGKNDKVLADKNDKVDDDCEIVNGKRRRFRK